MNKKNILAFPILALIWSIPQTTSAFIPLICDLCTVGVVAGLGVSRYFGIDDTVSGVWIGALIVALISGTIQLCEKKGWKFRFRDTAIALSFIGFTGASLYFAGVIGIKRNVLFGIQSIFGDKILVSAIVGALVLMAASSTYQYLKRKNNGKAHFPFERVALPIAALALTSTAFYFLTLK